MTGALVVTSSALQLCLERATQDWFDDPRCPDDGSWGALSLTEHAGKSKVTFIIARGDEQQSSKAVILSQDGGLLGATPSGARHEMLQRVHRVLMSAVDRPLRLPFGWSSFQHENLIAFFACRRDFGAWRWIAEIRPDESEDTGFWLLTHSASEMQLAEFSGSAEYQRALKIYRLATGLWATAFERLSAAFEALPAEGSPERVTPAIDLEGVTFGAVTKHLTFSSWMNQLTPQQRDFVQYSSDRSLKLRGPAGSGKTLALALKALREFYTAKDVGRELRILFATHSWSTAEQVDAVINRLDERGDSRRIDVYPLLEVARERLPKEHSHGVLGLLGHDSLSGRRLQLERINGIVSRLRRGDWIAYRDDTSPEFQKRVEAESGSPERNSFSWDLMMEFSSVLGAQGIFPGASAERRYVALERMAWMMPLATPGEKRFVLRVYAEYVDGLRSEGVLTADQLINDFLSYLATFTWNALRKNEGYDLIFVDELHLFSEQERLVLNYLTRSANEYPILFMALDPRQAPSEVYGFAGASRASRESGEAEQQLGAVDSVDLRVVHRFSSEILDLIRHVHQSYPALDLGEDWAFDHRGMESSVGTRANRPTLTVVGTFQEEMDTVLARAGQLLEQTGPNEHLAIVLLDPLRLTDYETTAQGLPKLRFTMIRGKDDVEKLRYSRRSLVVSAAEYVAGLQFSHVLVSGFPRTDTRGAASSYQLRRLLSSLYLAVSRASDQVELYANEQAGDLPEVLESAIRNRIVERS